MVCEPEEQRYKLYVESENSWEPELISNWFDDALANVNSEWAVKRVAERMQEPEFHRIPTGSIDTLRTQSIRDGFADPLYVLPHLQNHSDIDVDLSTITIQ